MSEQQNIQTVKSAYAAFKRGDIQGVLNTLTMKSNGILPAKA